MTSIVPMGDRCWLVKFEQEISPKISGRVRHLSQKLEENWPSWLDELVPTYCSLAVYYNPLRVSGSEVKEYLQAQISRLSAVNGCAPLLWEIPTLYGGNWGMDLLFVAEHSGLTPEEVIAVHSGRDYLVYMLGFVPGFCYLGGMAPTIAAPRLSEPRRSVPSGSVGIAGMQTGIYPVATPGGWRIIGRTPLRLYDPYREPAVFIRAGDYIRFKPVTEETYTDILSKVEQGWQAQPVKGVVGDEGCPST